VAQVVYAAGALDELERAFALLGRTDPGVAAAAAAAIRSGVAALAAHPLLGQRLAGELRELVISYGRTGYVALYRFVVAHDEVRVLGLRQQRQLGFLP
jgi:plasmid stabilization system protein ParE